MICCYAPTPNTFEQQPGTSREECLACRHQIPKTGYFSPVAREVMVLQHPPVLTLGTSSTLDNVCDTAPFELFRTERGGEVTYAAERERPAGGTHAGAEGRRDPFRTALPRRSLPSLR